MARLEALVPPVSDAATSPTTPIPPPTTPTHTPAHTHHAHTSSHTHTHLYTCVSEKVWTILELFLQQQAPGVLAVGPKNGPKVTEWRIGQKFCRSKLFTCLLTSPHHTLSWINGQN